MNLINEVYTGAQGRKSPIDVEIPERKSIKDFVLFVHGYKGYKDWGPWRLVQQFFTENEIGFAKLNLSHNGGTVDNPIDFPDLEAFGKNCYSFELKDIEAAIDFLGTMLDFSQIRLWLIGHSRGGGDVILSANNPNVYGVITWASISDIRRRFPNSDELEDWKTRGVRFVENARTKQQMPHYYSFYEDWLRNQDKLNIEQQAKSINKPSLHIHGTNDEAVVQEESMDLQKWTRGELELIHQANHTFGAMHPWSSNKLPNDLLKACQLSLMFILEK